MLGAQELPCVGQLAFCSLIIFLFSYVVMGVWEGRVGGGGGGAKLEENYKGRRKEEEEYKINNKD